jgi:hypothetical protein
MGLARAMQQRHFAEAAQLHGFQKKFPSALIHLIAQAIQLCRKSMSEMYHLSVPS